MKIFIYVLLILTLSTGVKAQGSNASATASATGSVLIPSLQSLNIQTDHNDIIGFMNADELDAGKLYPSYFKAVIVSNLPWIVSVRTSSPFFLTNMNGNPLKMPANVLRIKPSGANNFKDLGVQDQAILFRSNNKLQTEQSFDLQINPGWNYPGGEYSIGLIFTLTSE